MSAGASASRGLWNLPNRCTENITPERTRQGYRRLVGVDAIGVPTLKRQSNWMFVSALSLSRRCVEWMYRMVPETARITSEWVVALCPR